MIGPTGNMTSFVFYILTYARNLKVILMLLVRLCFDCPMRAGVKFSTMENIAQNILDLGAFWKNADLQRPVVAR